MSLCASCYWNTANDFFEPSIIELSGHVKAVNECVNDVQGYPKVKVCVKYESAHRIDEE